jgi:PAS domain S-box-containing protein
VDDPADVHRDAGAGASAPLAALAHILKATAAFTGQRFFEALATSLARVLGVRYVLVGVMEPGGERARTVAFCVDGALADNIAYDLRGTPCATVCRQGEVVHYQRDVARLFPEDVSLVEMGAQAYLGAPITDGAGHKLGLLVVMHDRPIDTSLEPEAMLTIFAERASAEIQRSAFEATLRAEHDFTRGVLDGTTTAMLVLDPRTPPPAGRTDGGAVVRFANAAMARMLGMPREALEGRPMDLAAWGVVAEDGSPLAQGDLLARVVETGLPAREPVRALRTRASPDPIWVDVSAAPLRDASGAIEHVVLSIDDVTPLRALELKFAHAQKMEAVGRLAGGIAHDFNNLLTVLLSHAELALEGFPPGNDDVRDSLEIIRDSARRASGLTRQLLAFSRRQLVQPAIVDLGALVQGVRPLLARLLGENVTVSVEAPAAAWHVRIDPGQLDQVLMNLVVNARDAMPGGGRLRLSISNLPARAGDPLLGPLPPGDYLHLAVQDSGSGMDAATLRRAFEPFFTTKGERGTGLGLATCASVVEHAGGRIFGASAPGEGTTFHVLLPRHAGPAPGVREPESRAPAAVAEATVLVVEDDDAVRATAARAIERAGHRVLAAASAREAVRLAEAHPGRIDLLFSDVVLPDGTGPEVGERVRGTRPDLRILFVSGHTDDPALRRAAEEGRVALRAKPYTPDTLARWVAEALREPASKVPEPVA